MIAVRLIGWFSFIQIILMLVHMHYSTSAQHTLCANVSNKTYQIFKEGNGENFFLYYKSNVTEVEQLIQNIEDHTTVILNFCTKVVKQQVVIQIANKMNIVLHGLSRSHTEVRCHGNESGYRFTNVTNLTLSNISFINCGSLDISLDTQGTTVTTLFAGIFFYFCESVMLTNINIRNSTGTGVAFVDTVGHVEINNSSFENSNFHNKHSLSYGIYIKFSSRKDVYKKHSQVCRYVFHNNSFINNSVSSYHNQAVYSLYNDTNKQFKLGGGLTLQFEDNDSWCTEKVVRVTNCTFKLNTGHRGGSMKLYFMNSTTRNSVTIKHCDFTSNRGDFGGGLSVTFSNNSYNNRILLSHIRFSENHAEMGGGAVELDFHFQSMEHPETNNVSFKNCTFVANRAKYGGGTVLRYSRAKLATQNYIIKFVGCTWEKNKALFGSAIEASLHASDTLTSGYVMSPVFKDCQFMSNSRLEEEYKYNDGEELQTRFSWGKGVFFTTALPILFKGSTMFFSSNTSALCASSSIIEFAAGSNVNFTNNMAFEGGAVNLLGLSEIHVNDNSTFLFYNNTAIFMGGAIIYRSGNKLDFVSSRRCFIQYAGNTTLVSERSITVEFENNSALPIDHHRQAYGHAIYATTLIPCRRACTKQGENRYTDIQFGCIGNVTFWNYNRSHEVSTDGAIFSLSNESNRMTAIPGKEFELKFKLLDENGKEAYGSYHVTVPKIDSDIDRTSITLDPAYSFIKDKTIKLYGEPGHKARVVVATNNFRDIAVSLEVELEECPPGFVTQMEKKGIECVCSANTVNKTYFGILRCEFNSYRAYLIHSYWIGYDNENGSQSTLRSGYCPRGFCVRRKVNEAEILLPLGRSRAILNEIICGKYRQGRLCGSCSNSMSVYYHSNSYYCYPNNKICKLGFLLYMVSEIMPVTVLFMIVLFFNVKFTSGALNGFIFFIQFIDTMWIDANGFISTHDVLDTFMSIYLFTYRMFNLNFFTLDRLSFCLWEGANTLDIFTFKYVTVVYSIVLVLVTVLLKKFGKGNHLIICCKKRNLSKSSNSSEKSTMIHGFSAFFVMCYSQCAKVTLFILTPGGIRSLGRLYHNNITFVVFYHGEFKYLQGAHFKYALPAFIFGIALVLIPPLLLVVYPLCYKVLALLHIEETRCLNILCRILPLERMKPMFDSFQSCFKDNYRFFAGLYFLYRLVALLSFLFTDSLTKFYIVLEVQLIVMLSLQAITYPYRRRWHNVIDVLLFANLAVINAMTIYNYKKSKERYTDTESINTVSAIQTILVSTPFVCMVCFIILQLVLRIKRSRRSNQERNRDELTDTLTLVDYRQLEDSKSL